MIFTIQTEGLTKEEILTLLNLKKKDLGNYMATFGAMEMEGHQERREFKQAEFMTIQIDEAIKEISINGEDFEVNELLEDILSPSY